jgi:hypothetical protein
MPDIYTVLSSLWPVFIGFITLVVVLARMHYNIESINEKVKVLFDFHNKRKNKGD